MVRMLELDLDNLRKTDYRQILNILYIMDRKTLKELIDFYTFEMCTVSDLKLRKEFLDKIEVLDKIGKCGLYEN